jgi:hypothetical protein
VDGTRGVKRARRLRSARSEYGRGSLEHRGDCWWVRYSRSKDGSREQRREGPFNSREAAERLRDGGVRLIDDARMSAGAWLLDWSAKTSDPLREDGRRSDAAIKERHVRVHLAPRLEAIRLGDIKVSDLNALYRDLLAAGLSRRDGSEHPGHAQCRTR